MTNDDPKLEEILIALKREVAFGRTHLGISLAIRRADPVVIHTAQTFFGLTHDAHLAIAQMYAAKLYDKTKGSLTVRSLLIEADRLAGRFSHASAEEVRTLIGAAKARLDKFEKTLSAVEKRRNEYLAHLDIKTVADPTALDSEAMLTIDELDELFVETGNILNEISQRYDGTLSFLELTDSSDYETVLTLIAEAKRATSA